jgi:hypothetical protein
MGDLEKKEVQTLYAGYPRSPSRPSDEVVSVRPFESDGSSNTMRGD